MDVTKSNDHQSCSLASVQHVLKLRERRLFNTAITYQRHDSRSVSHSTNITIQKCDEHDPSEYSIVLHVDEYESSFELACSYQNSQISSIQAKRVADTVGHILLAIIGNHGGKLENLDMVGKRDLKQLWTWNEEVPHAIDQCVHDLFTEQVKALPDAPAICAWDGELTYGELDVLSSKLASHLVQLGVKPEDIVPLCFEKSMWTVVAMLAVLKAGGAFVPLDPEHPVSRHEDIFKQTNAKVLLTSAQNASLWANLNRRVVTVSKATTSQLPSVVATTKPSVEPGNTAYVIFTSGSTGVPKGVMLEHRAVATSCLGHGQEFGITGLSRVLQFASYTFDACIAEIITTLLCGGCICVPSDSDRRNSLAKAISTMDVNWAFLTPSVARLLDPGLVPSLKILAIGGEQSSSADWNRWPGSVQKIHVYGPTECCIFCTGYTTKQGFEPSTIGTSVASVSWVVDPENHDRLAPLGSIGELLVEGPILARGYLNDVDKTAAAFIDDPVWLLEGYEGHTGRQGRLYKMGDLVRYDNDGNLVCLGRKDSQVKVRGQRVELGEVEHHVRECLPEAKQLAVEVIVPEGEGSHTMLAAFMRLDGATRVQQVGSKAGGDDSTAQVVFLAGVEEEELAQRLPRHMVPTVFFTLLHFPMTTSGKTDRKRLREMGASFTAQQLAEMRTSSQGPKRQPSTDAEQTMQRLWARVLGIEPDSIGLDDSFFRLGGDSIAAMKLVGEARQTGLQLSVADIFRHPKLAELAGRDTQQCSSSTVEEVPTFSLLGEDVDTAQVREEVAAMCSIDASIVEDVYPCTPLQEGLMSLTAKRAGDYIMQSVLELRPDVDEDAFCAAWEHVVQSTAALRTRIVQHNELDLLQVVVKENTQWTETQDLERYLKEDKAVSMGLGDPLAHYALVKEAWGGKRWFVWTIHHALYDGGSLPLILHAVKQVYSGAVLERQTSFNAFIQYLSQQDLEATAAYWQTALSDCEAVLFPPLPSTVTQPVADTTVEYQCPPLSKATLDTTTSTLIRAAWAIVTSCYTSSDDVVFGTTVAGRNAPIAGVEAMVGPTIATVPVRLRVQRDQTVFAFLQGLQQQSTDMIAHEQTGLQHIAKLGSGPRHVCGFQTLLVVQPVDDVLGNDDMLGEWRSYSKMQDFTTYALMVQFTLAAEGVQVTASFDARVIEHWVLEKMLRQFSCVMQQLAEAGEEKKVADIDTTTPQDRQQLWAWNADVPPAIERCVHNLFAEQARARPGAPAICAWDGELTYGELDALSSKLAGHLVQLGVKPEDMVPLCFEKSMWTVVAMLAVLKAGGAFVPLDPDHPASRHEEIFKQTGAQIVLTSSQHAMLFASSGRHQVTVGEATTYKLDPVMHSNHSLVQPTDAAYIMFTSGSTGVPKGVVLEHRSVVTSCLGHGQAFGITNLSRVLQFASYTFDACIAEIITTLVYGGCICVPSHSDRHNDLANAISTMDVNWALLTPSVARMLDPGAVQSLKILVLGGEQVNSADWDRWRTSIQLINGYGPTECSVCCNTYAGKQGFKSGTIGTSIASVSWVVDPKNHDRLAPLGSIGELLVEGPILARGYLNDIEKTEAAFIDDPAWLLEGYRGHAGRRGRLYKTGDLVRYDADGNLVCLGRKDSQVKVRGQRVELGEIEHHVRECLPEAKQLAVEVVLPSGQKDHAMLAAFVQLGDDTCDTLLVEGVLRTDLMVRVVFLAKVEEELAERLPGHMVPTVFFTLLQFPTTTSGKTDRKRLQEIGASFTAQQLAEMRTSSQGPKRQPSTEAERTMQRLWARVLGIELDSIGLDDSFFRLGGDSITAMQISSSARALHLSVSTGDILKKKTIALIACKLLPGNTLSRSVWRDPVNNAFDLTPIQHLYLTLDPSGRSSFDQCFFLELHDRVQHQLLVTALTALVQRHSMLRARFQRQTGGRWRQYISEHDSSSLIVKHIHTRDTAEIVEALRQSRGSLDIERGPVLAAVLCDAGERQSLFVAIHHLVVDLVSWRVLLEELEDLLLGQTLPPALSTPFQAWHAAQAKYIEEHVPPSAVAQVELDPDQLSYWGVSPDDVLSSYAISEGFVLDRKTTSTLLGSCNDAFSTRPLELMVAALSYSFATIFSDRKPAAIFNEIHGREAWDSSIDLTRTVGWFTSMCPVQGANGAGLLDAIRETKDCMRSFQDNGWSYFASQFASASAADAFASLFPVEVLFNYQGLYQQLERKDSLFKNLPMPDSCEPASAALCPRFALFDVSLVVEQGCAKVSFVSDSRARHQDRIKKWIQKYMATLVDMSALLPHRSTEWTLSDLPLSFSCYIDLDRFRHKTLPGLEVRPEDVEDVFPCTPMQEGILTSQAKDLGAYWVCFIYEVIPNQETSISLARLQQAWKGVVHRHSLLRTLLVDNVPGSTGTTNVVLKGPQPSISVFSSEGTATIELFRSRYNPATQRHMGQLQHYLSICQLNNGKVYLCLDINHAIIDAHSRGILMQDFQKAYDADLDPHSALFCDFASYTKQQSQEEAGRYWAEYLDGVEPCHFPSLGDSGDARDTSRTVEVPGINAIAILAFCRVWEITPATIIQTAWALVLSRYTNSVTPCFGNLSSGRDLPIHNINDIFGPLIAMLPCQVHLHEQLTVLEALRTVQRDYASSLPYQTFPLANMHSLLKLGTSALFNTALSLQRIDNTEFQIASAITLKLDEGLDPTEYDIMVNAGYSRDAIEIGMTFRAGCVDLIQAIRLAGSFSQAMKAIIGEPNSYIHTLEILTYDERETIWARNADVPPSIERCVYDLFMEQANARPDAPAICAWDGEMSYGELDALSTRLASHLVQLGVQCGDVVPLCFEKSMWTVVAMLAILKAGGAFVPLDPDHPASRHEEIFKQTSAQIVLTSSQHATLFASSGRHQVTVSKATTSRLDPVIRSTHSLVKPTEAAYIMFTSGSTGVPKGVVLEHRAVVTSCLGHGQAFGITTLSRVLQFTSYTFDFCIAEIVTTLLYGGCICVPSDRYRHNDLAKAINAMDVNWALLTPSVARMLDPGIVQSLKILVLGGEQVNSTDWDRWPRSVQLINGYGPTECCIVCTGYTSEQEFISGTIGSPIASVGWVVDPENHNRLAPLGSIGELLVEGPILARGYLNDAEKTAASFVDDPAWLLEGYKGHTGRQGRLYKTGDLVRYDTDGNLVCLGRKDSQVKVRGQRVELGEVEHHVRECLPEVKQLAVEVVLPSGQKDHAMLAAFVQLDKGTHNALLKEKAGGDDWIAQVVFLTRVEEELAKRLPEHMVPTVFFSLLQFPTTTSGKTDRKRLQEMGASFTAQQLAEMRTSSQGPKRQPSTEAERTMQRLWARVLGIELNGIGLDDSFFRLGGDSIVAMKLVGEARRTGLQLSVADIFRHPRLVDLAHEQNSQCSSAAEEVPAFSLLGEDVNAVQLSRDAAAMCSVAASIVEDIYPCSPLQEGLMLLTAKRAGDYIMQSVLELQADVDEDAFRAAWECIVQSTAALRTRIVQHNELRLLQVVVAEKMQWTESEALEEYLKEDKAVSMGLGDPLARYALIKEACGGKRWFVWTVHHAVYDGWSLPLILHAVKQVYSGVALERQPSFNAFIQYLGQQKQKDATSYWQSALVDCEATLFPPLPSSVKQPVADTMVEYQCPPFTRCTTDMTMTTLIRAAWALVASRYTSSDDVVFGTTVTGRNAPVAGIEAMVGPTIATVPLRVHLQKDQVVPTLLECLQQQATGMIAYEQTGLQHIAKMGPGPQHACGFQTLLVVQPADDVLRSDDTLGEWRGHSKLQDFTTYALMVQCTLAAEGMQITASFDARVVEEWVVEKMLRQFSFIVQQLAEASEDSKVADIDTTTPEDRQQLWAWNQEVPPAVDRCIHDLFTEQVKALPDAPAICAWDGELTYGELDALSSKLAGHLIQLGVKREDMVPLCFEKSMWTVVAMLAVLKAGGVFVPLDPEHPRIRQRKILEQTRAKVVVVSSKQHLSLWADEAQNVIVVSRTSIQLLSDATQRTHATVYPMDAAYVLFTSGSTGKPKGVVIEHKALSTSCLGHGKAFNMSSSTRALQFTSYTADISIAEIITTLVYGGCICIPSHSDRLNDISLAIQSLQVNWAYLTPTVARLIDADAVPSLDVLLLGGAPVTLKECRRWKGKVELINTYGPTESCVLCSAFFGIENFESGLIGKLIASVGWVVDPEDHDRLAPLGSVGELLVEGPILARGYLNDVEKTEAAFIDNPAWLLEGYPGHEGRQGRLYKTGDLVRYSSDGNLVCLGRKDGQVKVHGQRVELGEVEHHVRECLPKAKQLAVEVVPPSGERDYAMLAAFIRLDDNTRDILLVNEDAGDDSTARVIFLAGVEEELAKRLPKHMVPTVFFALLHFPTTTSGKTDRKRLREIGASFTAQQLAEMRTSTQGPKRQPSTEAERTMQRLWARVLSIEPNSIGLDDSFFRIGGDSIAAMKLVGEARRMGLQISVADIFRHPKLADLAGIQTTQCSSATEEVSAYSLLGEDEDVMQVCKDVAAMCSVDTSAVNDVYPCSPLQEGLMSLTAKRSGDYIMQMVLELRDDVDEDAFRAAWEHVVQLTAVLRTRIVQHSELGLLQVVVKEKIQWTEAEDLEEYLKGDREEKSIGLGDRLTRYALIKEACSEKRCFAWTIHHAVYDGWSLPLILHAVKQVYSGGVLQRQPSFNAFIQYLGQQDHQSSISYWQTALANCEAVLFPPLPSTVTQSLADITVEYQCPPLSQSATDITMSTLVRAAWAIVTSRYTSSDDVVFGTTVTGRNAPIVHIDTIVGPTITTVPVRVRLQKHQTVFAFLKCLQQQVTDMIAYEQTGLQRIAKIGSGPRHACGFQTLLVVQPADDVLRSDDMLGEWRSYSEIQDFTTYALMVQFTLAAEGVQITASFDARVIEHWVLEKMLRQFSFIMQQLPEAGEEKKVADIDTITPQDRRQLWAWNQDVPPAIERCVHELFAEQARARPGAPAICAWDGELTYGELDALSSKLAGHLIQLGVKPEDIVPLCFEKSVWTVVAMLAVLKAGGAFVPLDPDHPASRREDIFRQTGAQVVLTSVQHSARWTGTSHEVVTVSEVLLQQSTSPVSTNSLVTDPRDAAYVIFTSGSTGIPKGVVLEHRSVVTSCLGHGRAFGITELSRVLQFSSYTFDACIAEIMTTLLYGGCICVPSDNDRRNDLATVISTMDVNCALLTPSVARLLEPSSVPSLQILVLQGEQVSFADWNRWPGSVQTINGYGPTECCVFCTGYTSVQGFQSGNIGTSIASVSWVVDPGNHNRLAPLGSIGELLVEGPILARGYLNDVDKTAAAFIDDPVWLLEGYEGHTGRQGRLYKTGDLVRYDNDGNLVCLGRKDSQVKVRGQRVELGEIEHHVRECLPEAKQLAVEVVLPSGQKNHAMLAAFVQLDKGTHNALLKEKVGGDDLTAQIILLTGVEDELAKRLPGHMVPTVFFALLHFPTTTSGKTDRTRLQEIGASFTAQQLAEMQTFCQGPKRQPSTEAEQTMQQLWAQVLRIKPDSIGLNDSFFRLGGDSIAAMKLVGEARRSGLQLSVADIFRHPKLAELAGPNTSQFCSTAEEVPAFSLLSSHVKDMIFSATMPFGHSILMDKVVDVLPVSYIQEFYIANGIGAPREAFNYFFIDLGTALDVQVLKHSCCALLDHFSILRTHFLDFQGKLYQVIPLHQELPFSIFDVDGPLAKESMAIYIRDLDQTSRLGLPTSFTLVRAATGMNRLIIRLSHAQYDGVCLPVMLRTLATIYQQEPLHLTTGFHNFLAYVRDRHSLSVHYWRGLLAGSYITNITSKICPKARKDIALQKVKVERNICTPQLPAGLTMASLISSAWAVVLSHIIGKEDVVYGLVVAGRNSNLLGITELMGPCINIIPVRVQAFSTKTSMELLQSVQDQYVSLSESDSMGLDDIIQHCTDWPAESMFDSIVQHQNIDEQPELVFAGKHT
ncbi:Destruxin synthetase [Pyrenophora teres f. teres]|uniref:Nonribosomal peptide synthetase 13 n=1 Tax=Pyrenophora teres f. teres TaxID=97479 RepID=A0A6S6VWF3_9PLEO|nr:Destruxin synthetase [Pyrenophora teres f. teres]